jgi:single-strand DNA-binding protein
MSTLLRLVQLNNVQLVGRLTRDPELRFTTSGAPVCRFDLAVNRRYKDKTGEWKDDTSFIPVVVWREAGQRCGEKLKKGSPVYVEGRLKSRNWETKDGQKRSGHEVDASRVQFLEKAEGGAGSPITEEDAPPAESDAGGSAPLTEDVPF